MLKFQNNNTTVIATFEDFILTTYVIIDELYHQFALPEVAKRRHVLDAKLSDSEIITISLCGELLGVDSENAWFSFVKKNYRHLFPRLCSRSRFNRTRRALMQTTELLRQKMLSVFPVPVSSYCIIDSFPLAVCKFGRARYCKTFRSQGADYGKCPSKKETYFGYKVHALVTLEGYITAFEITPASTDDREGLRDLVDNCSNITILADKGYVGEKLMQEMQEQTICLFALKRSNSKENWPKSVRQLIFKLRRRVETVFSQLSGQLNAERVLAKSFQGLCTRLVNKVLAYNLCIALNSIFGETCELGKIKELILLWSSFFVTLVAKKIVLINLCCRPCFIWGSITIITVWTNMIIINVCKFFYLLIECFLCCKLIQICAFILQGIEVTLHRCIVVRISCFAHALCHIYRFAEFGKCFGRLL